MCGSEVFGHLYFIYVSFAVLLSSRSALRDLVDL